MKPIESTKKSSEPIESIKQLQLSEPIESIGRTKQSQLLKPIESTQQSKSSKPIEIIWEILDQGKYAGGFMENISLIDRTSEILSTFINQEIEHVLKPRLSTYVKAHGVMLHCRINCYPIKPYVDVQPPLTIYPSENRYMY